VWQDRVIPASGPSDNGAVIGSRRVAAPRSGSTIGRSSERFYESHVMLARPLVKAQRREAWGELLHDAVSNVVRPRPHGRSTFALLALERKDQV
jgi:hypothetical protein